LKRKWLLLFALFVLAVLATGWLFVPFAEPRIGRKSFDKIQLGWTVQQAEELLGEHGLSEMPKWTDFGHFWIDDDLNAIYVKFDRGQVVSEKLFIPSKLSLFERLKRRIQPRIQAMWP